MKTLWTTVAALAVCAMAAGQVRQTQIGQALDANNQIGSGGYNTVVGGVGGVNSQLYINGQVTGLNYFHGHVGYTAPDQLSIVVPSAAFSDFQRSSVGLRDVLAGPAYAPAPYYHPSQTVSSVGTVPQGGTVPGQENFIGSLPGPGLTQKLYANATAEYKPLATAIPQLETPASPPANRFGTPIMTAGGAFPADRVTAPTAFTGLREEQRQMLVRQLNQAQVDQSIDQMVDQQVNTEVNQQLTGQGEPKVAAKEQTSGGYEGQQAPPPAMGREDVVPPGSTGATGTARPPIGEILTGTAGTAAGAQRPGTRQPGQAPQPSRGGPALAPNAAARQGPGNVGPGGTETGRLGGRPEAFVPPPADQDVYLDLLVRLYQVRTGQASASVSPQQNLPDIVPNQPGGRRNDLMQPQTLAPGAMPAPSAVPPAATPPPGVAGPRSRVELAERQVVVHSLAGISPDQFNLVMAAAEKKLLAGKFYEAANDYETASLINSSNPLARVGMALAYFGAGEPLSAAISFRRAIEVFPPIMETKLDLAGMIKKESLERQINVLDERLAGSKAADPQLTFLAAFLNKNMGNDELAVQYARRLEASGTTDKYYLAYAHYVLTGKRPVEAATRPATSQSAAAGAEAPAATSNPATQP